MWNCSYIGALPCTPDERPFRNHVGPGGSSDLLVADFLSMEKSEGANCRKCSPSYVVAFRWFILFELIPTRIGKYISLDSFGFLGCYQRSDSRQSRFLRKERAVFATLNGDWASLIALFRPIAEDGCVHGRRLCKLVAANSIVQLYHWSSSASKVRGESQNITGRSLLEAAMTSFPYWAGNTFGERLMCPGSKCFIHPSSPFSSSLLVGI